MSSRSLEHMTPNFFFLNRKRKNNLKTMWYARVHGERQKALPCPISKALPLPPPSRARPSSTYRPMGPTASLNFHLIIFSPLILHLFFFFLGIYVHRFDRKQHEIDSLAIASESLFSNFFLLAKQKVAVTLYKHKRDRF